MMATRFTGAVAVALLLALPLIVPAIGHVDTWKIELGLAGLVMFLRAGMSRSSS